MKRNPRMKRMIAVATIAFLAAAAVPVLAQHSHGRGGGPGGHDGRGGGDVARMVLRHVDLSETQRDTIREIVRAAREERSEGSMQDLRAARHEMVRVMWSVDATEADVQAVAARLAALDQAAALERFRVTREILDELTPEQQAEVQAFLADPPERRARRSRGAGPAPGADPGSDES